jgi:D-glycero-D-manno-heptose 1,7-bisphosphate phosphatase
MKRPAVFFDRDNTLIVSDGYLGDPGQVTLVDGAPDAVARARSLGFATVVFSNQSGVARGMFNEDAVHSVNAKIDEMLLDQNQEAVIDRHEFCPFHPEATVEEYRQESDLRKPKPGMILEAAEKLALDLSRSWVIGDAPRDIEAGKAAGCKTIWFKDPNLPPSQSARELMLVVPDAIVATLKEATDVIARDALVTKVPEPVDTAPAPEAEEPGPVEPEPPPPAPVSAPVPPAPPPPPPSPEPVQASEEEQAPPPIEISSAKPAEPPRAKKPLPMDKPWMQAVAQRRAAAAAASASTTPVPDPAHEDQVNEPRAPVAPPPAPSTNRLEGLVEQILMEMRRRTEHPETEFSVSKLMAGIVQVISLATLFLAYMNRSQPASLQAILLVAIFLQVLTIALLIMGKQR